MRNIVIITARSNSSRLINKHFLKVKNKPIIQIMIDRIKTFKNYEKIVIATTINKNDDKFESLCKKNNIECFRGSEFDVTGRVLKAADFYHANYITLVTGDCPLVDISIMEQLYKMITSNNYEFITNADTRSYPDGMDVHIFKKSILKKLYKLNLTKLEKEHVPISIRKRKNKYKFFNLVAPDKLYWPELGLTLDEKEDYILIKEIINRINIPYKKINCEDIIKFLKKNKKLLKVNASIIRRGDS